MFQRLSTTISAIRLKGQKWFTYFPVQNYLIAFLFFSFVANYFLQRQIQSEPSAFNDILLALIKLVKTVFIPLMLVGFATVLFPFIWLWFTYRKRRLHVSLESPQVQPGGMQQELQFEIKPLWQPLFGQVYFRLIYDKGNERSPRFTLVRKENAIGYAGKTQTGWYRWPLPGIREYEIESIVIYMEDFFHFFRLAMPVKVNQSFFTKPTQSGRNEFKIEPGKTENEDIRIKDWRRVEGEWLQYKHFESNDDVRRIVWKIYARNKELVVRSPEVLNPFASHVSMYVSFFNELADETSQTLQSSVLDFYKAACYTLYKEIEQQNLKIRYFSDQPETDKTNATGEREIEYKLATSNWQHITKLEEFVKMKDASVLCISSLCNPDDVKTITEQASSTLTIVFVPLSMAAPAPRGLNLLKWLWIETENEPAYRVKLSWFFSPVRRHMIQNEENLLDILKKSGKKFIQFSRENKENIS
jgi:hypothetical protein